jgi:hypothetical protein
MNLAVTVDLGVDPPVLDHARGSGGPVRDQSDVEAQLSTAP